MAEVDRLATATVVDVIAEALAADGEVAGEPEELTALARRLYSAVRAAGWTFTTGGGITTDATVALRLLRHVMGIAVGDDLDDVVALADGVVVVDLDTVLGAPAEDLTVELDELNRRLTLRLRRPPTLRAL